MGDSDNCCFCFPIDCGVKTYAALIILSTMLCGCISMTNEDFMHTFWVEINFMVIICCCSPSIFFLLLFFTFVILFRESEVEEVCVRDVSVQDPVRQSGVIISVLVSHVNISVLQAGPLLGVLVALQLRYQSRLAALLVSQHQQALAGRELANEQAAAWNMG